MDNRGINLRPVGLAFCLSIASVSFGDDFKGSDLQQTFQRQLRAIETAETGHTATSADGLNIRFDNGGTVTLANHHNEFSITALAFGKGTSRVSVTTPTTSLSKDDAGWPQLNLVNDGISQWYVNGPTGLHHWMKIAKKPANTGANLWVKLGLSGRAVAKSLSSSSVQVQSGKSVLTYSGLKVWDRNGHVLPARLDASGQTISVVINDTKAVYPITIDPNWTQKQKVTPPDGVSDAIFGTAVALSGDSAIIGAPGNLTILGAAYYFSRRTGGVWTFEQKLVPATRVDGELFGSAIAIDGNRAIIGAPHPASGQGEAYIFTLGSNYQWTQDQKIIANFHPRLETYRDQFGLSVAMRGDRVVVGAIGYSPEHYANLGATYIFSRGSNGIWTQEAEIVRLDGTVVSKFGNSVAITTSGVLVGAPSNNPHGGMVNYYERASDGTWTLKDSFHTPSNVVGAGFGSSISVSGNLAVVGAPTETTTLGSNVGVAYLWQFGTNDWRQLARLAPLQASVNQYFGTAVSVVADKGIFVGAPGTNGNTGQVYFFNFQGNGGTWNEYQKFAATDSTFGDTFGTSLAQTEDYAMIGSPKDAIRIGAAYLFNQPLTKLPLAVSYPTLINYSGTPGLYGGLAGSGTVSLPTPAPLGGTAVTLTSNNANVTVPAIITVPAGATTATFPLTTVQVAADATVTITATATDFSQSSVPFKLLTNKVTKIVFGKTTIYDKENVVCRVDLAVPALSDYQVTITNQNSSALIAPIFLIIPTGQRTINTTITGRQVAVDTPVTLTATPSNATKLATIIVKPGSLVSSLTFQDSEILYGQSTLGKVNLQASAPTGGLVITLASSNTAVTVPPTVTVPAGQSSAEFNIQSVGQKATSSDISASLNGSKVIRNIVILRPRLASFTLSQTSAQGGVDNPILTATLVAPAPTGGVVIKLLSSKPGSASVPATVTIPEGSTSASVTVATSKVSGELIVNLSGQYATDNALGVKLTIQGAVLASVTLDRTAAIGGVENATLTATLTLPAPAGGIYVNLSSNKPTVASVPSTVFIPEGAISASVTVTTYPAAAVVDLIGWITGSGTKGQKLTVTN